MRIDEIAPQGPLKLDAYGDGGFRLSGVFHPGSLLLLPDGPRPWAPVRGGDLTIADFEPAIAARAAFEVLLIGVGARFQPLPKGLRQALQEAGLAFDAMDTGAACRTFNVLLVESRRVAAALIAID